MNLGSIHSVVPSQAHRRARLTLEDVGSSAGALNIAGSDRVIRSGELPAAGRVLRNQLNEMEPVRGAFDAHNSLRLGDAAPRRTRPWRLSHARPMDVSGAICSPKCAGRWRVPAPLARTHRQTHRGLPRPGGEAMPSTLSRATERRSSPRKRRGRLPASLGSGAGTDGLNPTATTANALSSASRASFNLPSVDGLPLGVQYISFPRQGREGGGSARLTEPDC
jgi:hypothetical protein